MNPPRFRSVLAVSIALAAILGASMPVQAGSDPDGAVARLKFAGGGGIVILHYTGTTTVNAGVVGLQSGRQYALAGHSAGCSDTSAANRLFRVVGDTTSEGAMFANWVSDWPDIGLLRSVSLSRATGGGNTVCAKVVAFSQVATGDVNGDGLMAEWGTPGEDFLIIVEALPFSRARVSIVGDFNGDDIVNIRGSNRACGSRAGTTRSLLNIEALPVYSSKVTEMSMAQFDALRSVRLRNLSTGRNAGCQALTEIFFANG